MKIQKKKKEKKKKQTLKMAQRKGRNISLRKIKKKVH